MGQITTINLTDSVAAVKTYAPQKISGDLASWQEKSSSESKLFSPLQVSLSEAAGKSTVNRGKLTLAEPYEVVIDSLTTIATMRASVEFIFPDTCSQLQRDNFHAKVVSALGNTLVVDTLVDLNHVY